MTIFRRHKNATSVLTLFVLVLLLTAGQWFHAGHVFGQSRLIVWFFDVGQGDAIFIESPSGEQLLIDGGRGSVVLEKLADVMPFWDRSIDAVLLTHPHADHVDGLVHVLERYDVETVYTTGVDYLTSSAEEFSRRSGDDEELVLVDTPRVLSLGGGVTLELVYPQASLEQKHMDDVNDASIVGVLRYGETSILLTGDIGNEAELSLIPFLDESVDILKVGHHGSRYSTSQTLLETILPSVAIISSGEGNEYGHPHAETLERLSAVGATILRTDLHGDIRLLSTGGEPWLTTFAD